MIHEKSPQYPYYQLPFKGDSTNNTCFQSHSAEKIQRSNATKGAFYTDAHHASIGTPQMLKSGSAWGAGMSTMSQANSFGDNTYETTNQRHYKGFQTKHHERPQTCKPRMDPVRTGGYRAHFKTKNNHELKNRKYKHPAVDMIPYP